MMTFDDLFARPPVDPVPPASPVASPMAPWKVLIADDDAAIHAVTELALEGFRMDGRPLAFLHAYSGAETLQRMAEHPDIAVLLLDVVMESDSAGLDAAKAVRERLGNRQVRIVLNTGQPGSAPKADIIARYDIDNYREKGELTERQLFTLMYSCLRGYRDIAAVEQSRQGLRRLIDALPRIFHLTAADRLARTCLEQLAGLTGGVELNGLVLEQDRPDGPARALAACGRFADWVEDSPLPPDVQAALALDGNLREHDRWSEWLPTGGGGRRLLYLNGVAAATPLGRDLLALFVRNLAVAFDNLRLKEEIEETQREIVFRLGEAVETRNQETGNHLKRVSEAAGMIAAYLGYDETMVSRVRYAAPLHDIGKIGIPDHILNKRGGLDAEEWKVMQTHADIGWRMLKDARQDILRAGAVISLQHHEKWDGTGYPRGLRGDEIDPLARIVAAADVFDALGSHRPYKTPWPLERILEHMAKERGRHFDPAVVDAILALAPALMESRTRYPDIER
ncbi:MULTISPECIES: response regulator [Nitrospirillum]|uniref:Metal dependent phosphohydrolase n=1 Tax=Nitrospirillum amazonense TaxID=28077 RepID=A0A560FXS6_9PROT|nr:response regulator [Nitrospirillum amazonense]MEC4594232.1 HD domain-containing phosphohydrolase [Nitrospirillum amazonense]TWB26437.1 metal dependent phosphohydrolase [Nitrospirillum amazonense]